MLLRLKASGKYHLPGGGIELGELMAEALQREVREETGLAIQVGSLAFVEELFFYYDPSQTAYHGLHFYLEAIPLSLSLTSDDKVQDGSAEKPRWVPIAHLQPDQFQSSGAEIIDHCRRLANSQINKGRKKRA